MAQHLASTYTAYEVVRIAHVMRRRCPNRDKCLVLEFLDIKSELSKWFIDIVIRLCIDNVSSLSRKVCSLSVVTVSSMKEDVSPVWHYI